MIEEKAAKIKDWVTVKLREVRFHTRRTNLDRFTTTQLDAVSCCVFALCTLKHQA